MKLFKFRAVLKMRTGFIEAFVEQDTYHNAKAVIENKYKCTVVLCHII